MDIFMHPMKNYWNEKTRGCLYLAAFGWMGLIIHYQYYHRNFVLGREHGSAEWADPKQVMKTKGDKQGRILSQHITISKSGKKIANNNMIVVGAPGTGKSFRIVAPNLLRNDASVVVLDVKGDLLRNYGKAMEKNGYQIKCLDVISSDFGKSHMYNPFVYIKAEVDLIRLVTNIQTSLTPQDASKGEPFWEDGVTMYLLACFYYVWLEMEEPTLPKVQLLMNEESRVLDEETGETELEKRMNTLVVRSPMGNEHLVLEYE
ncbi:type IV secretory system conjugative DNA transfer family protein [Blautia producta]|nr:type IV secretory system conjugative DNA transfer family protein [Blautia producta]